MGMVRISGLAPVIFLIVCLLCASRACAAETEEEKARRQAYDVHRLEGSSRKAEERLAAVSGLAGIDEAKAARLLAEHISEDDSDEVAARAAETLAAFKSDEAADEVCKAASRFKGPDAREVLLLETLGRIQNAKILPALMKLAKHKDRRYRILALEGLAHLRVADADVVEAIEKSAKQDEDFGERLSAVTALAQTPHAAAIPLLVAAARTPGRIRETALRGLMLLTGQALGEAPEAWETWWKKNSATFAVDAGAVRGKKLADIQLGVPLGAYEFYGIKIYARRVLFLIDKSGSMAQGDYPCRIDGVKAELTRLVDSLDESVQFNLIFFSHLIRHWKGMKLQPADAANKKNAKAFIQIVKPDGATHTDEVMEKAFRAMVGPEGVETICLLTDGAPFRNGKFLDMEAVAARIRELNRFARVQIHTFGCFTGAAEAARGMMGEPPRDQLVGFLKKVATENAGDFQEIQGAVKVGGN